MRKAISAEPLELPPEPQEQLRALNGGPDVAGIPEAPAENWFKARRFHKIRKEPISIRVDSDVLDWFRARHEKYQVEINKVLRARMDSEMSSSDTRASAG